MLDVDLMYTCSLIEELGRTRKLARGSVVSALGRRGIQLILDHACVLHSEPIEAVADEYSREFSLPIGFYDNVACCHYTVPDCWTIGEVFARLVTDVSEGDVVQGILDVYSSWIANAISDYNSDLYYQPRDYLRECYFAGEALAA